MFLTFFDISGCLNDGPIRLASLNDYRVCSDLVDSGALLSKVVLPFLSFITMFVLDVFSRRS